MNPPQAMSAQRAALIDDYLQQNYERLPGRKASIEALKNIMKQLDFHADAEALLPSKQADHTLRLNNQTGEFQKAVRKYLGFSDQLTVAQQGEVKAFVFGTLYKSSKQLGESIGQELAYVGTSANVYQGHLQCVVDALGHAETILRPDSPEPELIAAVVKLTAMRYQRKLFRSWIEELKLSPEDRAARLAIQNEEDAALARRKKGPGRPEMKRTSQGPVDQAALPAAKSLQVLVTVPIPTINTPSPYANLGTLSHGLDIRHFQPTNPQQYTIHPETPNTSSSRSAQTSPPSNYPTSGMGIPQTPTQSHATSTFPTTPSRPASAKTSAYTWMPQEQQSPTPANDAYGNVIDPQLLGSN